MFFSTGSFEVQNKALEAGDSEDGPRVREPRPCCADHEDRRQDTAAFCVMFEAGPEWLPWCSGKRTSRRLLGLNGRQIS